MPVSNAISATQAAEAICLLISDHATACGYLHELNGEQTGMSRNEFKAYLRSSSQEEYFELLGGHIPAECATLVTKAAQAQEKRKAGRQTLAGQAPAKDTAKQLFQILDLKTSSGLHFKDVRKAMKALPFSDKTATSKPTGPITPPNPGQQVKARAVKQAPAPAPTQPNFKAQDVEKPAQTEKPTKSTNVIEKKAEKPAESAKAVETGSKKSKIKAKSEQKDESEKLLKRKQVRQARLDRKEARKARKARRVEREKQEEENRKLSTASTKDQPKPTPSKDIAAAKQATTDTTQVLSSAAADTAPSSTTAMDSPSTAGKKSKKRKHDATSAPDPTPTKATIEAIAQAKGEPQPTKSQLKREAKRLKKANAEAAAPLAEKTGAPSTKDSATTEQEVATKGSDRDSKKRKVSHEPPATSPAVVAVSKANEMTMTDAPVSDLNAGASTSIGLEQGDSKKIKKRRPRRKSTAIQAEEKDAKESVAPVAVAEDVNMASSEPEEQHLFAPTQETSEFVSAIEPENPFSDQSSHEDATATDIFQLARTMLPVVEPKSWSPESSPTHRSPALSDFEASSASDLEDEQSLAAETSPVQKPQGESSPQNSDVSYESLESWAKSSLHEQMDIDHDASTTGELAPASHQIEPVEDMVEAEISATPDELASAQLINETNASTNADAPQAFISAPKSSSPTKKDIRSASVSTHRSNQSPVRRLKELSGIQRLKRDASPATSIASSGWGTSLTGGLKWSGKTSIGFAPMPPVLPRVGMVLPKANSIPSNSGDFDVNEAFRNFNKYLNNGHSSEQSDDSSSSSDSEDEPPLKVKTVAKPGERSPVGKPEASGVEAELKEPVVTSLSIERAFDDKSSPGLLQAAAEPIESADAYTSTSKDQAADDHQLSGEPATKSGVTSFSSFNEHISSDARHDEASPSPDLDLPALMDEGGYMPRLSGSSHAQSANHNSDNRSGNDHSGTINVDLLSPFKNDNGAESPTAEGTVRPSEMIEYTSSPPPFRRSPAKDVGMDADGVQHKLDQQSPVDMEYEEDAIRLGSSSPLPYPVESDHENERILVEGEDEMPVEDGDVSSVNDDEDESSGNESGAEAVGYDEVVLEEPTQATEEPSIMEDGPMTESDRDAASPEALPEAELDIHITDNQPIAESRLPAHAGVQSPENVPQSQLVVIRSSPMVVIHRSSKSELAKFQHYSEVESCDDAVQEDENVRENEEDAGKEAAEQHEDDPAEQEESARISAAPGSASEEADRCFNSGSTSALLADGCLVYSGADGDSDNHNDPDSSMEWEADDNLSEWEAAQPSATAEEQFSKRQSTGTTSKHFSATPEKKKAKSTGTTSKHFSVTPEKKKRVAGESRVPFPKLDAPIFGLIQEKLWKKPFHLLCAVLFLNKTSGKSAKDTIMKVLNKWPNPYAMARADFEELLGMIESLGLQNERANKLIKLGETFENDEPRIGKRHRTLHYPNIGDGKMTRDGEKTRPKQIIIDDFDEIEGFLEIGHVYGAGPYAYDSWRIFCRDVMRGVATGYNGEGAVDGFEPEWKRVVPKDKELRACLRWMWLREGWDWDPLTGEKQPASIEKMNEANQGIAGWIDPVPVDPHGVDLSETGSGPDALVPGVDEEVRETIEQPHQGVQDDMVEEAPPVARVTRRSTRQASAAAAAAAPALSQQITEDVKPQKSPVKTAKSAPRKTSQEMEPISEEPIPYVLLGSPEETMMKHPHLFNASARALVERARANRIATAKAAVVEKRKRSLEDEGDLPLAKMLKTTSADQPVTTAQVTPMKAHPSPPLKTEATPKRLSPRSIRRLKREMLEEYEASLLENAAAQNLPPATAPTPTTSKPSLTFAASQPKRAMPSPMDSPAKNTRQRVGAKAAIAQQVKIVSSPPQLARGSLSPSPSSQLLSQGTAKPTDQPRRGTATTKRGGATAAHKAKPRNVLYKGEPTDILYKGKVRDVSTTTTPAARSVATRGTPVVATALSSTQPAPSTTRASSSRASSSRAISASQPVPGSTGKLKRIPKLRERMLASSNDARK